MTRRPCQRDRQLDDPLSWIRILGRHSKNLDAWAKPSIHNLYLKKEEVRETFLELLDVSYRLRLQLSQVYPAALMKCMSTNLYIL